MVTVTPTCFYVGFCLLKESNVFMTNIGINPDVVDLNMTLHHYLANKARVRADSWPPGYKVFVFVIQK